MPVPTGVGTGASTCQEMDDVLTTGILNADLAAGLARLRHTDVVAIADCGLPAPRSVPVIDLALVLGVPRFTDVLSALCSALTIESVILAEESRMGPVPGWVAHQLPHLAPSYCPHDGPGGLKYRAANAALLVRSGEATPFANVLLRCGVPF